MGASIRNTIRIGSIVCLMFLSCCFELTPLRERDTDTAGLPTKPYNSTDSVLRNQTPNSTTDTGNDTAHQTTSPQNDNVPTSEDNQDTKDTTQAPDTNDDETKNDPVDTGGDETDQEDIEDTGSDHNETEEDTVSSEEPDTEAPPPTEIEGNTITAGKSLMPNTDGWVTQTEYGFQGAWWTYSDYDSGGESVIYPDPGDPLVNDGTSICVHGTASMVIDEEYSVFWGAGIGMDLCANSADQDPPETKFSLENCPFSSELVHTFRGVEFDIEGKWGSDLRCTFSEIDRTENAYVEIPSSGGHVVALIEDADLWYNPGNPVNIEKIETLQFQIATNPSDYTPFDFCITNLEAIID